MGVGDPLCSIWRCSKHKPDPAFSTTLRISDTNDRFPALISWAYRKSEFEETVGISTELVLLTLQNLEQGQVRS